MFQAFNTPSIKVAPPMIEHMTFCEAVKVITQLSGSKGFSAIVGYPTEELTRDCFPSLAATYYEYVRHFPIHWTFKIIGSSYDLLLTIYVFCIVPKKTNIGEK